MSICESYGDVWVMRAEGSHVDRGWDVQGDFFEEVMFKVRQSLLGVKC